MVEGEFYGRGELEILNADIIRDATAGCLTFAEKPEYFQKAADCEASAVLIPEGSVEQFREISEKDVLAVSRVSECFAKLVSLFRRPLPCPTPGVSEKAVIDPSAQIGPGVHIAPGAVIGPDVVISGECRIHAGVHLMSGVSVGTATEIFPNVVVYENCILGAQCRLHANCVIGAHGFGYESSTGEHFPGPQLGNVVIGDHVEIGAGTSIDRATFGSTSIGEGTKIDNQVQIGHNCRIGKRNLICAQVGIAGSCTTGDNVVLAGQVGIGDHISIGQKTILGAKAGVMADIPEGQVYLGAPATPAKQQMSIVAATHRLPEMRRKIKQLERQLEKLQENADAGGSSSVHDAA